MSAQIKVEMSRHFTERRHSTWTARVPVEMLSDPTYFNASGIPTPSFDQWMCDNGVESNVSYSSDGRVDDDLNYEVDQIGGDDPWEWFEHNPIGA